MIAGDQRRGSSARSSTCARSTTSGRRKISTYLKRDHDVDHPQPPVVWRILKRLDLNRLPSSQRYKRDDRRWKRYEKQQPGHRVQIDVKFIAPIEGTHTSAGTTSSSPRSMMEPPGGLRITPHRRRGVLPTPGRRHHR